MMRNFFCSLCIFAPFVKNHFWIKNLISRGFWKVHKTAFKNFCMGRENFCMLQKFYILVLQPRKNPYLLWSTWKYFNSRYFLKHISDFPYAALYSEHLLTWILWLLHLSVLPASFCPFVCLSRHITFNSCNCMPII